MRISQLAERCGVRASTLRFYESTGLLPAERTRSGYRVYGEEAVDRLAFIGAAKRLGLSLEEIGELLGVWESGVCAELKAELRPRIAARLAEAERRMAWLVEFAASLRGALEQVDALPDRNVRCDPECGFVVPHAGTGGTGPVEVVGSPNRSTAERDGEPAEERWRSAPVACSLAGDDLDERMGRWRAVVEDAIRTEIPEGVRLTVPVERAEEVVALAVAEQRCCPFFDFRLRLDGERLHAEVRAPADGAGLLADLFGSPA